MQAVWTNVGLNEIARYIARLQHAPFTQRLRLFTNDITPTVGTTIGEMEECALSDYVPYALEDFTFSGRLTPVVEYYLPILVWEFGPYAGPPVTIYGAYSTNIPNTLAWWCKRQDPPYTVPLAGGRYGVGVVHRVGNLG